MEDPLFEWRCVHLKFDIDSEKLPSQKESSLPTTNFSGATFDCGNVFAVENGAFLLPC